MKKSFHFIVFLIAAGISVAQSDLENKKKKVIQAIKENDIETVLRFISEGNDIDGIYGKEKMTLLNLSIKLGNEVVAKELVKIGADKNKQSRGKTPLMFCTQYRETGILRFLVRNGADVNAKAKNGNSALIFATKMNKLEDVRLLVENGADVSQVNDKKMTALDIANSADFPEIAEYLVIMTESRHFYTGAHSYNDGPYVDRENDTTFRMYYFAYDTIKNLPVIVDEYFNSSADTLKIKGFASDTNNYVILKKCSLKPAIYENVSKFLAIGDFHGQYLALVKYLINNKIVDENLNWIWGDGHLVFGGDVTDRGSEVTESLWFIYHLDLQARKAGGRVHMLLGNHEVMVMTNDTRYLNEKYAFFSKYFSRDYALNYSKSSVIGRWLRSQNTVIKINGFLISHAGISPFLLSQQIGIDEINSLVRDYLVNKKTSKKDDLTMLVMGVNGPLWYRGYVFASEKTPLITQSEVDSILKFYDAEKMIIAHTENGSIKYLFDQKVIAIDVPIKNRQIISEGLFFENGELYRANWEGIITKLF